MPFFTLYLFAQMAEKKPLQDALLAELSDVNLFCKLIKYPSIRDNMLKTFKVSLQLIFALRAYPMHLCFALLGENRFACNKNKVLANTEKNSIFSS